MIGRLFQRGVLLNLESGEIRARSAEALRASLADRIPVSPARLAELGAMSDRTLEARATALDALTSELASGLAQRALVPGNLLALIQEQDVALTGDWPETIATARRWDGALAPFQRTVLEALQAHVLGERECVRVLIASRHRRTPSDDVDAAPRQRLLLDPVTLAGGDVPDVEFDRLPKGDPLAIAIAPGQALELMLAHHRFLLICGVPWLLVDDVGEDVRLAHGRNVVGRSPDCETVVHENYRAISRRHVVLETRGTETVVITDLSSLGTFVPSTCLGG